MQRTAILAAGAAALAVALAAGCATTATLSDEGLQTIAAEVAIARVIEQTSDPRATATAILDLTGRAEQAERLPEDPTLVVTLIHDQLGYKSRPASERLLIDALAESIALDVAGAVPGQANRWVEAAARAARAVIATAE